MNEFSEDQVNELISQALNLKPINTFGPANYLGLAETNLLEILYNRLTERYEFDYVNDFFEDVREEIISRKVSLSIKDVHTITKNCKKCEISSEAELPKWNVTDPDIVVVVDSPNISQEAISLMVNSFKKVGLNSQQLCLTYVNRCPVKRPYDANEVINCSPYLHQEIQILNPRLILCLGGLPSSVIFGDNIKIKERRGEIIWLGYWPTLTTYSPAYVLKQMSLDNSTSALEQFENDIAYASKFITQPLKKTFNTNDS